MHQAPRTVSILFIATALAGLAHGEVVTKDMTYTHGDVELVGYLAYDDAVEGKRPGVLVIHEWWGLNDYAKRRARMLAALGYVAFAADMYGRGKVTADPKQAGQWAGHLNQDKDQWMARAKVGLKVLADQPQTDGEKLGAIGYCFGGSTVLNLAIGGADLDAVVSFHGSLPAPTGDEKIKAAVLVCHGAADGFTEPAAITALTQGMNRSGADWQMVMYGGAKHSFTNPGADGYGMDGVSYDKRADHRSWAHMKRWLKEAFADPDELGVALPGEAAPAPATLVVNINEAGELIVDGQPSSLEQLRGRVADDSRVIIRADRKTPLRHVVGVMDALKQAGVTRIAMAQAQAE